MVWNSIRILMSVFIFAIGYEAGANDVEFAKHCPSSGVDGQVQSNAIRVLTLNISHGRKTAMNQILVSKKRTYQNLDEIRALLERANVDVVALQEADAPSRWSGKFDHVEYLSDASAYPCTVHGYHSRGFLATYGTALLLRIEPVDWESVSFTPTPPSKQKGYVSSTLKWIVGDESMLLTVASVHLDFISKKNRTSQIQQMIDRLSAIDGPLIVMGDFNSEWAAESSHVRMLADGLGLTAFEPDGDELGTYKKSSGSRLDWILISSQLKFVEYRVLPDVVADHFAVYAEIGYRGE